jgi:hypothetical protein
MQKRSVRKKPPVLCSRTAPCEGSREKPGRFEPCTTGFYSQVHGALVRVRYATKQKTRTNTGRAKFNGDQLDRSQVKKRGMIERSERR